MEGYLILGCIIGGQALGTLSEHIDATIGIVIIGLLSLLVSTLIEVILPATYISIAKVSFCGYKVLHRCVEQGIGPSDTNFANILLSGTKASLGFRAL